MIDEAMHFRVEYLLRQAALEPELEHYWLQVAAEWMVKGFRCAHAPSARILGDSGVLAVPSCRPACRLLSP